MKRAFGLIAVAGLITGYALQVLLFPPLVPVSHAQAAWWDTDWGNRYEITVDNTGNGAKTTYQVRLELTSANFDFTLIQADGDDFRVLDGDNSTVLDYCLFDLDIPGETATLWWNEPTIGAGASETAYLYVNNASATNAEDCDSAFTWHDDFKDVTALGGELTDTDPTIFNTDGYSNPVIPLGGASEGDEQTIREHSPVYWDPVGSQWVVLYTGEAVAASEKSVYIATSTNRTSWTKTQIIDSAAQDDNPALLYDVTNGHIRVDDESNYLIFIENDPPASNIKLWKSATLTSGWTEFGTVMSVGAAAEWDDTQVGNPYVFWPGSGTTLYMTYEGLASTGPDVCDVGFATSTDWGETWTKYDAGVGNDSDPIISSSAGSTDWDYQCIGPIYVLLDGSTYYLGAISSTNYAGRYSTTDTPATWDNASFTPVADESYLKDGYHVQPFLSSTANGYVMYQNNAQDGLHLANVIGETSAKWLAKRYTSDTELSAGQQNVEEDDTVPIYIDGSDQLVVNSEGPAGTVPHSIVLYSDSAITVTDDWEIIVKMSQTNDGADDTWWNLSVGEGVLTQPTAYTASFNNGYMLLTEDPGTANSINIREITAGALGARNGANNYPAAHANAMNERSFSYTGGTLTYTAGATTGTYADTTFQATTKQIAFVQGEHVSSGGAISTIDWFLVRNYDGEDASQSLAGVESAPSPADPCAPAA